MRADTILDTIGGTPHIRINRLFGNAHTVYIKSERSNPGGSIKDRIALAMVEAEAAREMARRAAREEGMLVGISSGATLAAIAQKLPELPAGSSVLGFNYDTGERYLLIEGFLPTE